MDILLYGMILFLVLLIAFSVWILWWLWWQVQPVLHRGGPYVPSRPETVKKMIALAELKPNDVVYDLGSGDGRIIFEAVKQSGCRGMGIEIDPWLVNQSNEQTVKLGLENRATFECADFWKKDFSKASVIFLFQISFSMRKLEKKLQRELRPGAKIISNHFVFPNWAPKKMEGEVRVYVRK